MRLAIMGAAGRMGRELIRVIHELPHCGVAGAVERPDSPFIGKDAGEVAGVGPLGVKITSEALPLFTHIEGVLDFTSSCDKRCDGGARRPGPHRPCHRDNGIIR